MPKDKRPRGAAGRQQAEVMTQAAGLELKRTGVKHPRKALYRARAHANPLSDSQWPVPACPSDHDWSDHFQEFFHAAKGTSTALNDNKASTADALSARNDQHQADPNTASQSRQDPPASMAQTTLQTVSQAQDISGPVQTGAPALDDDDPQTMQQLQHEQANCSGQADLQVRFADVGCGFGGLLVRLSPMYPDKLMVGMEIRDKHFYYCPEDLTILTGMVQVTNYVIERVAALRREQPGKFTNITALRTNAMRHLPNYFVKGQLHKLFFLFPDPHFKTSNHRRRIIQTSLLAEYAYCLAVGGMLYTITDVQELGEWMRAKLDAHPLFERVSDSELSSDPAANLLTSASEEAQKVARNEGKTFRNIYRRIQDPES